MYSLGAGEVSKPSLLSLCSCFSDEEEEHNFVKFLDDTNFEELYCHPLDAFEVGRRVLLFFRDFKSEEYFTPCQLARMTSIIMGTTVTRLIGCLPHAEARALV